MIRLSPSLLESFRLFCTEDWFTHDKMVEAITGKFTPTPQIILGQSYHKMLEDFTGTHEMYFANGNPQDQEMLVKSGNHVFAYEPCIEPVADFLQAGCVHEVYGLKTLDTQHGQASIATKADAVHGNIGGEWKTTEKAIQLGKYMNSVQWKLCAWTLGLRAVDYRIIRLEQRQDDVWTVRDHEAIQCVFSPSHLEEILHLVDGLIHFHKSQGLDEFLIPYYDRPAKAS